jgi:hypothetical protein
MFSNDEGSVELEDVWGLEAAATDPELPEDERPVIFKGVDRSLWVDICRRVKAFRPSMRAGEIYGDGELCGVDWWLSKHVVVQYLIATCLRQPGLLKHYGLVLVAVPGSDVPMFAVATPQ